MTAVAGHGVEKKAPQRIVGSIDGLGTFEVIAFSWGAANSGTTHVGGGAGAGKANVQDLSLTKYVDAISPKLVRAVVTGQHRPSATLTFTGPRGTPVITYVLDEVLITSLSTGGSASEVRLTENVSINFAAFTYSFNDVAMSFDIVANK